MSARSTAHAGRALAAAEVLVDTCVITRADGEPVLDPDTNILTQPTLTVYEGPCRLKPATLEQQVVVFGGIDVTRIRSLLWIPWDAPDSRIDDICTIPVSEDPHIGLRTFRITGVPSSSLITRRTIGVEVIE